MTGREGETFPGFFYGRRGQPDTDVRGSPLVVGGSRGLGSALIEGRHHYDLEEGAVRGLRRRLCGAVSEARGEQGGDALRGPHSGLACSGGGRDSMLLEKNANTFLCLFGMLIE